MIKNKWFKIKVLNDYCGYKKDVIIYARKCLNNEYEIFDGINKPYNQAIKVNIEDMKNNFKSVRINKEVQYVDDKTNRELNTLLKSLNNLLY